LPVREEADLLQCTALRLGYFLNGASASCSLTHVILNHPNGLS